MFKVQVLKNHFYLPFKVTHGKRKHYIHKQNIPDSFVVNEDILRRAFVYF